MDPREPRSAGYKAPGTAYVVEEFAAVRVPGIAAPPRYRICGRDTDFTRIQELRLSAGCGRTFLQGDRTLQRIAAARSKRTSGSASDCDRYPGGAPLHNLTKG